MMETLYIFPNSPIKYEDVLLAEDPRDEHSQPFLPEVHCTVQCVHFIQSTLYTLAI